MKMTIVLLAKLSLKKLGLYSLYTLRKQGPLLDDGWFRSFRAQESIDADGNPLPWITYPAIEFLSRRINKNMSVFEYGSGGSTLWWASRVKEIISCEHDESWYEKVLVRCPSNVMLCHVALEYGGAYSQKVKDYPNKFDVVVVDGRDRVNCAKNSVSALKPGGVILWDNTDRNEYIEGRRFLLDKGFRQIEFVGLSPSSNFKCETSLFYRDNNCLGI